MSKILVAYFSASGVTKNAAEKLAKAANAEQTDKPNDNQPVIS